MLVIVTVIIISLSVAVVVNQLELRLIRSRELLLNFCPRHSMEFFLACFFFFFSQIKFNLVTELFEEVFSGRLIAQSGISSDGTLASRAQAAF